MGVATAPAAANVSQRTMNTARRGRIPRRPGCSCFITVVMMVTGLAQNTHRAHVPGRIHFRLEPEYSETEPCPWRFSTSRPETGDAIMRV